MNVIQVNLDGVNRFIHDSVYGPAVTREIRTLAHRPDDSLEKQVLIKSNEHLRERAGQIILIGERSRGLMAAAVTVLDGDDDQYAELYKNIIANVDIEVAEGPTLTNEQWGDCRLRLMNMVSCTPNQGFATLPKVEKPKSCDQYRLCPWCRYRIARKIFEAFVPYLTEEHEICVTHFDTLCDPEAVSVLCTEKDYAKIAKAVAANRDWTFDYMVSLPAHTRGADGMYRLVWRTSLIAVVEKEMPLSAPETFVPKKLEDAQIVSDGVVYRFPATEEGLTEAFKGVFAYPKWMLLKTLTSQGLKDMLTVLALGDRYRSQPHGGLEQSEGELIEE